LIFADPEGGDRQFHVRCWPLKTGILGFCPGNGCDVCDAGPIYGYRGGYVLLPEDESLFLDDLPCSRTENRSAANFALQRTA
jgi:hypothetical protein